MQVFERRDWVAAQMRQQVESYDQSLACALLAAGRPPPPWLLPSRPAAPQGELLAAAAAAAPFSSRSVPFSVGFGFAIEARLGQVDGIFW